VMRIVMEDGHPKEIVPVITGFHVSNAVVCRDGYLYVSETQIDPEAKPATSGVFRFKLEELEEAIIELATPETADPHLIATLETFNEELPLGADGLCFDGDGNLYIGNFSDGTIHKLTFDAEGNVTSNEIFAKSECMKCADGVFFDPKTEKIYVADSKANAVQMVSLEHGLARPRLRQLRVQQAVHAVGDQAGGVAAAKRGQDSFLNRRLAPRSFSGRKKSPDPFFVTARPGPACPA